MFDALGIPLFDMRCPCCSEVQQVQANRFKTLDEPILTRCCSCKEFLALYPEIQCKPNKTLFTLEVVKVPSPKSKPAIAPTSRHLGLVSNETNTATEVA